MMLLDTASIRDATLYLILALIVTRLLRADPLVVWLWSLAVGVFGLVGDSRPDLGFSTALVLISAACLWLELLHRAPTTQD